MKIIFETERLYLREFTVDDVHLIYKLNDDPEVIKYVHEPPISQEIAENAIHNIILPHYKKYGYGRWAMHLRDDDTFIGWCGLKNVIDKNEIDLGYRIMKPYWGKGYSTEAAKTTLDYGFNVLKMQRIIAKAHIDNIASWKIMEKLNMKFIGELVEDGIPLRKYEMVSNM